MLVLSPSLHGRGLSGTRSPHTASEFAKGPWGHLLPGSFQRSRTVAQRAPCAWPLGTSMCHEDTEKRGGAGKVLSQGKPVTELPKGHIRLPVTPGTLNLRACCTLKNRENGIF